jgi:hypothetical protein
MHWPHQSASIRSNSDPSAFISIGLNWSELIRSNSDPSAQILINCSSIAYPCAENLGGFKWVSLAGAKYIE